MTVIAVLAIAGGVLYVMRRRERASRDLTDAMIEQIERVGTVEVEEPLDLDDIAEEEERFWNEERWDEADEY